MNERHMRSQAGVFVVVLCLLAASQGSLLFGQYGRASITGIVSDPSGAVIPGVSVAAVNAQTQVRYETTTNQTGNYLIGLPIGEYLVTFSASGFKELSRSAMTLATGQVARIDITLEVGEVTERLSVTAEAPLLETETAHTSESVNASVFKGLPLSFSAGRNMAEFAAKLTPGVRGSSFTMQIEGQPGSSVSIVVDGMSWSAGWIPGNFREFGISPEAIQEMTVFTGAVSADLGNTAGGALNFVLKSGTNQLHGSGLYYLRNEILNANDWNNNRLLAADPNFTNPTTANFKRPMHRRQDKGFSVGGPVYIPKVYNGKDRTFFYVTIERFMNRAAGPGTLSRSVPQPEMFDGDLSRLLTGKKVGTDPLGRSVYEGQIYDPTTLRQVNGQFVADPFLGNIIPPSRVSQVARNFQSIFNEYYPPATDDLANNLYSTRYSYAPIKQDTVKVDHAFSSTHKVSGYYYKTRWPQHVSYSKCLLWSLKDPELGGPLSGALLKPLKGHSWSVSHDWMISPALLNHATVGGNRKSNANFDRHKGVNFAEEWGIKGVGFGVPGEEVSQPRFELGSSPVATFQSWGIDRNKEDIYQAFLISDTVSWMRGAHSLKFGFEFSHMTGVQYNFTNSGGTFRFAARTTSLPGQSFSSRTGNSFASFLLGEVDSAFLSAPFIPDTRREYAAAFVHDDWKVTRKLTLNLGLRWNGNSPLYEKTDQMANFNPNLPDPNANNLPGAVEYMGFGSGRAGKRSAGKGSWRDWGPNFGFAYQVTNRTVVRGGYSITYTPESIGTASAFTFIPTGFVAGLLPTNSVAADSKGLYRPVFNIDDGYPGQTVPPNLDPSWGQKNPSTMISPSYTKPGYVQHFSLGFQTQVAKDLVVELGWRAAKGTRFHAGHIVIPNQIRPEYLSKGAVLGQWIDSPEKAAAAGLPYPYPGWQGKGANTLMPFPQITTQSLTAWGDPVGFSNYHSGNLIVTKRMSKGFMLYGAYTFSKSITNIRELLNTYSKVNVQDTYDRGKYKAISPDDRTHVIKSSLLWELPVGKGRALLGNANRVVNAILGNWTVSAILNYSSGAPLSAPASRVTPVGWNGGKVLANFNTPAGGFKNVFDPSRFNPWNANDPGNRSFDPAAFSDALPQQLGNSPVVFPTLRTLWSLNEDVSILKRFPIRERVTLELRVEFLNAFNRHYFGSPETNMNRSYFGNVRTASGARTGQCGIRIDW